MTTPWDKHQKALDQSLARLNADKIQRENEFQAAKSNLRKVVNGMKEREAVVFQNKTWEVVTLTRHDYSDYNRQRQERKVLTCGSTVFDPLAKYQSDIGIFEATKNVRYETKGSGGQTMRHADYNDYVTLMKDLPGLVDAFRVKYYQTVFQDQSAQGHASRRENPLVQPPRRTV